MTWWHSRATCGTWHVPVACATRAGSWRMWSGPFRRVRPPMATIPMPNERSAREDSDGGAALPFRTPTNRVLDFERCGGAERVNKNIGPLADVWRSVRPPTVGLPPLLSRLDDDLSNGGLVCFIQTSKGGVQRLL